MTSGQGDRKVGFLKSSEDQSPSVLANAPGALAAGGGEQVPLSLPSHTLWPREARPGQQASRRSPEWFWDGRRVRRRGPARAWGLKSLAGLGRDRLWGERVKGPGVPGRPGWKRTPAVCPASAVSSFPSESVFSALCLQSSFHPSCPCLCVAPPSSRVPSAPGPSGFPVGAALRPAASCRSLTREHREGGREGQPQPGAPRMPVLKLSGSCLAGVRRAASERALSVQAGGQSPCPIQDLASESAVTASGALARRSALPG